MDKVIREIQGANGVLTCGQKVLSKLDFRPSNSVGRVKKKGKGKGEKKKVEREALPSSRFSDDRIVGFMRSKRESPFSRQELQVETRNGEFRQISRGRSSHTLVIFYLKGCVAVSCLKGNVWLHFEP